jgi:transcription initiation factor TFIID subunit TAF12
MAALASIATVVGAGASVYGQVRQAQAAKGMNRAQVAIDRQQEVARQQTLSAQQAQDRQARAQALGRTIAATRARLAASGQSADAGSAGAVTAGLKGDAAAAQDAEAGVYEARLGSGRASLLAPDGTLTALLRSGRTLGGIARSLLD